MYAALNGARSAQPCATRGPEEDAQRRPSAAHVRRELVPPARHPLWRGTDGDGLVGVGLVGDGVHELDRLSSGEIEVDAVHLERRAGHEGVLWGRAQRCCPRLPRLFSKRDGAVKPGQGTSHVTLYVGSRGSARRGHPFGLGSGDPGRAVHPPVQHFQKNLDHPRKLDAVSWEPDTVTPRRPSMAPATLLLQHVRHLAAAAAVDDLTDRELLRRSRATAMTRPLPRCCAATDRWSGARAGALCPVPVTPRMSFKPRFCCWPARRPRCATTTRSAAGSTALPIASRCGRGRRRRCAPPEKPSPRPGRRTIPWPRSVCVKRSSASTKPLPGCPKSAGPCWSFAAWKAPVRRRPPASSAVRGVP